MGGGIGREAVNGRAVLGGDDCSNDKDTNNKLGSAIYRGGVMSLFPSLTRTSPKDAGTPRDTQGRSLRNALEMAKK